MMHALACEVQVLGMTWRPTARGEGSERLGVNARRLGSRDMRSLGRVKGDPHGAWKTKNA